MENTDNTLLEMQQQLQQLKDKLNDQKIVNERLLRNSCSRTANKLKFKSSVPMIAAVAALGLIPVLRILGFSYYFLGFTGLMLLAGIAASMLSKKYIPSVDKDLVSAAKEITRFKKINADWYKYGLPILAVWLGILAWDVTKNIQLRGEELYGFICGCAAGLVIGLIIGLKNRRDLMDGSDELLRQIEELRMQ